MAQARNQTGAASMQANDEDQFITRGTVQVEYSRTGKKVRVTEPDGQCHSWSVIFKPPKVDKCNLKKAMDLELEPERYNGILGKIRRDTQSATGTAYSHLLWADCPIQTKAQVAGAALAHDPLHHRFKGNWAALEIMKRTLRRAREDRIRKGREANNLNAVAPPQAQVETEAETDPPAGDEPEIEDEGGEHPALGASGGWRDETNAQDTADVPEVQDEENRETQEDEPEDDRRHADSDDDEQALPRATRKRKQIIESDDEDVDSTSRSNASASPLQQASPPSTLRNTSPAPSSPPSTSKGKGKAQVKPTTNAGSSTLAREDSWTADALQEIQEFEDAPRPVKKARIQKPIPALPEVATPQIDKSSTSVGAGSVTVPRSSKKAAKPTKTTTPTDPPSTSTSACASSSKPKAPKTTAKKTAPAIAAPIAGPSNLPATSPAELSSSRPSIKTRAPQLKKTQACAPTTRKAKTELVDAVDSGRSVTTRSKRSAK